MLGGLVTFRFLSSGDGCILWWEAKGVESRVESFQLGEVCEGWGEAGEAIERDVQELQGGDRGESRGQCGEIVAGDAQLAEGCHVADA